VLRLTLVLVALLLFVGCGGGESRVKPSPLPDRLQRLFDYERDAPLDLRRQRHLHHQGVTVDDITYAGRGGRVAAFLIVPDGRGKRAGVVFVHGYGGSRYDFLAEGVGVSVLGADVVTITMPFSPRSPGVPGLRMVNTVVGIRRAIDLLLERDDVDPDRLAVVGYSLGAQAAALVAGVEDRLRAAILQAPPARLDGAGASFDTLQYVRHAAPATLFVQGAQYDEGVPPEDVRALIAAAPRPVDYEWYPTTHSFNQAAFRDQVAWLRDHLDLR
jgi:dienelactone hydrolase